MKLKEIATIIAEKEDRAFDLPYVLMIQDRIKLVRSVILRQTLNQNILDFSYYLSEYNLEIEKIEEKDDVYGFGCTYLRSKEKLHPSLRVSDVLYFVGSSDYSESYGKVDSTNIKGSLSRKYTKNQLSYDIRDERLYLFNGSINKVGIRDILEYPEKLISDRDGIKESEVEFQATNDIIERIIESIWSIDLKVRDMKEEEKRKDSITNTSE